MKQTKKTTRFAALHAIATSSWSVAEAHGYRDGEAIPIGLTEQIIARITGTIEVPVTVDFEGGCSENDGELGDNVSRLIDEIRCRPRRGYPSGEAFNYPQAGAASMAPSLMSARRGMPRHMTVFPGGGSLARVR
jgi:hypothetical protein